MLETTSRWIDRFYDGCISAAHELRRNAIPYARFNAMALLHSIAFAFRCAANTSIVTLIVGCALHSPTSSSNGSSVPGSAELTRLYNADQVERADPNFFENAYASREAMLAQIARDSTRLVRVRILINDGHARTATDFFHAAIVAQHGADTTAYRQAAEWAAHAVMLDSSDAEAKWLTAAAHDRYSKAIGRPQCYGTQIVQDSPTEPWRLYEVDPACATDADRARLGVPPIATMRARVDSMNASARASQKRKPRQ